MYEGRILVKLQAMVGPTDATDLLEQCQWVGLHQQKLTSTASEAKLTEAVDRTEVQWRKELDLTAHVSVDVCHGPTQRSVSRPGLGQSQRFI